MKKIYLKLTVLLLTLIVGIGQMWADNAGLKNCYLRYDKNGLETTVTTSEGTTTGTETTLNEVTSLAIKGIWINNWTNSGTGISGNQVCYMIWSTHDGDGDWQYQQTNVQGTYSGNTRQDSWTGTINVVTSSTPSDEYYLNYYFESWYSGGEGNHYLPGNSGKSKLHYKVLPPNPSSISVSASSGSIGGSGTENSPYLVRYNGSLSLSTSGTRSFDDPNSSLYVKYGSDSYSSTTTKTISSITSTDAQYIDVEIKYYNSSASLSSATPRTKRVYYKVATYAITLDDNGEYQGNGSATAAYMRNTLTGISTPSRTGYHVDGYYGEAGLTTHISDASGNLQKSKSVSGTAYTDGSNQWVKQSATTLYTKWAANTYDVTLKANTGTGDDQIVQATYDADMPTTLKGSSDAVTVHTKTGYNLLGYWDATSDGNQYYSYNVGTSTLSSDRTWNKTSNTDLYAHWEAKSFTVTLDVDEAHHGTITGATTSQDVTYDGATTTVLNRPTAANGYALDGYYTYPLGEGVKVINADGTWIAEVDDYTDGSKNWVHDGDVTLYAYYKKAEITGITFSPAAVVAPSTSITATPTISPTPTGTTIICWRVLYSNDNPLESQPTFSPGSGNTYDPEVSNAVTFNASATSGMYKIEAVLRTGSSCGDGTELCTYKANFQVAGDHNVTVQYKDASGNVIAASTTVTGKPLEWSSAIDAPNDIFGYTFDHWKAGDGITLSENGSSDLGDDESDEETIYIKATYDGTLTAVYNKKKYIYLDLSQQFGAAAWTDPHVYFYKAAGYWDGSKGTGATNENCVGYGAMTNIDGTDIWYYDYGSVSNFGGVIAFTKEDKHTQVNFWETEAIYRGDFSEGTPVFVPLNGQVKTTKNDKCDYYNAGYWVTYFGDETGYTLRIKNNSTDALIKEVPFTSATKRMTMKAVTDLEATHTYKFEIMRDNGKYYKNNGSMDYSKRNANWKFTEAMSIGTIATTASGDYTFTLGYADNNNDHDYQLRVNVDYPVKGGDYRLIYKDDVHLNFKPSASIAKSNGGKDTVSFFVRPGQNPILYKQTATVNASTGAVTWATTETNLITAAMLTSPITKDSVYNFNLVMADADGALSIGDVKGYTGNYYIRTDGVNNKWDNYTNADHMMTYSEYAEKNSGYSHYFMSYVGSGTNVKFVVANDYSPCISDTLAQATSDVVGGGTDHVDASGFIAADANIRFMWKRSDNTISRKYLAAAKNDGSKFLVLRANSNTDLLDENGNALLQSANSGQAGYNHKVPDNSMQFIDDENWIYETTVKVLPSAYVKLYAHFHGVDQYYKGEANDDFDESNAIQLMTGSGSAEKLHVIYDFKTDRLVSAWTPTGDISTVREINADVMFVREHQGDIQQLTFSKGDGKTMGAITKIETAYGVLRFNKWTLNNKSKADGHAVLDPLLSRYERDLFYVSFPFKVAMNEVFGFGTYGVHWIIEEYDGADRAAKGYWADSESFWKFVYDRRGKYFEPNKGYIIALDLDELYYTDADHHSSVWDNNVETVELYFPSYGEMGDITNATVVHTLPEHTCTIGPRFEGGESRTIADSHWNVMSVPTYVNTSSVAFANTDWITEGDGQRGPNFLYEWNPDDNSLTARSGKGYTYHAMHAYMVQYYGNVTWTTTSVTPASVAARLADTPDREYKLELISEEQVEDQTFVRMTDDENVSAGFEFNYDLSKEMNKNRANIYTLISMTIDSLSSITKAAANVQPHPLTTTVVPVGVKIAANGEYTFSMPEGTNGGDVWLIDNANSSRTNLGLMDYTVNLTTGTYEGRFSLEFPVQNVVTEIENAANANANANADVRKVFVGGRLYILRDGKAYDATGAQVR